MDRNRTILENANRLAVLRNLALVNSDEEPFFDRLTVLASEVIGVPVSLVSMVAANYQFFKSSHGLPEPWASDRKTPLSHSFCQHVVTSGDPLIITDARQHDLVKDNKAIPDLNVVGYLGMPLRTSNGQELGSFCVIDSKPHEWTEDEIAIVRAFSEVVNAEIDARGRARAENCLEAYIQTARGRLNELEEKIHATSDVPTIIQHIQAMKNDIKTKDISC